MPTTHALTEADRRLFDERIAAAGALTEDAQFVVDVEFLDRSVKEIVPDLEGMDAEGLKAIRQAELHGKTRKSLIEAIEDLL